MRKFLILFIGALLWWSGASGQSAQFTKLYSMAGESLKRGAEGITTAEISGRMLRELMPSSANKVLHFVNRIETIRQVKFAPVADKSLLVQMEALAEDTQVYEQMSFINEDGQRVGVYKAVSSRQGRSEYLILISKESAALVCDIVGNISMKDIMGLLYGKQ
jgi:hypothetical protein